MKSSERCAPDNSSGRPAEERSRSGSTSAGSSAHFYLPLPNSVDTAAVATALWQSYRQSAKQLSPEPNPEPSRAAVRPLGPCASVMRAPTTPESITEEEESAESGGCSSGGGVRMEVEESSAYSTGGSGGARSGSVCSSAPTPQSPQSQWSPLQPNAGAAGELQRQQPQRSILRSLLTSAQTHSTTAQSLSPISPARLSPLSPQGISPHSAQSMSAGNSPMTLGPPMSLVRPAVGDLPYITLQQPSAAAAEYATNFRFSHMCISTHPSAFGGRPMPTPLPQPTGSTSFGASPNDDRHERQQHRPLKHSFSHTGSLLSSALRGEPIHKTAAICENEADVEMTAAAPTAAPARDSSSPLDPLPVRLVEVCLAKKNLITCTPRIASWLHHCVQFSLSVPAFKAMTRAQQLELLRCSWHLLLVLCMAEHNFHFAVSPVGDSRRYATAAQNVASTAQNLAPSNTESDASGSRGPTRRHSADVSFNPERNAASGTASEGATGQLPAGTPLPRTSLSPGPQPGAPPIRPSARSATGEQPTVEFADALQQLVHKLSNFGLTPVHFSLLKTALLFYSGAPRTSAE